MKSTYVVAAAVTLVAGALFFVQKRSNDAALDQIRHDVGELAKQRAAAPSPGAEAPLEAALRTGLANLRVAAPAPAAPSQPAPEVPPSPVAQPAKQHSGAEITDHYDAAFTVENADASWAADARRQAETRLKAILPEGSSVRSVDCRSSMCRIETSYGDRAQLSQFMRTAFSSPASGIWNAPMYSHLVSDEGGQVVVVSFLAREGHALPSMD
jgi:hypothetical protein